MRALVAENTAFPGTDPALSPPAVPSASPKAVIDGAGLPPS